MRADPAAAAAVSISDYQRPSGSHLPGLGVVCLERAARTDSEGPVLVSQGSTRKRQLWSAEHS